MIRRRRSRNPNRGIASPERLDQAGREALAARVVYSGSAHHKRNPGDYEFHPPISPRPWKSLCDGKRVILLEEAQQMLRQGVINGLFSDFSEGELPRNIWNVDESGEVYEAQLGSPPGYHGYRLEEDDDFRGVVLKEWRKRCSPP
jgi:hypothetical protein